MDYGRRELADRLAAEYVLGTLRGPARRRFESLMPAHPTLDAARRDWERRLAQLSTVATPVAPSERVWQRIEQRLFAASTPSGAAVDGGVLPAVTRWRQKLALWQGASGFAATAALALGLLLARPAPVQPPVIVVMAAQQVSGGTPGIQPASFVASVSGDGRSLVLKPLDGNRQVAPDKALELWALPAQGQPRSLGLVSGARPTTLRHAHPLRDIAAFAVSVEPPGGSPTGTPTGPIISVGKIDTL